MTSLRNETRADLMLEVDVKEVLSGEVLGQLREISIGGASIFGANKISPHKNLNLSLVVYDQRGREHNFQFKAAVTYNKTTQAQIHTTGVRWVLNTKEQTKILEQLIDQFGLWESQSLELASA
ncbi:MAG: PilZ domain-containing protein [SAR324 cluster bacterium]|nr:PilZ domain-containing protein [SAR324 cluster bacterium]